MTDEHLKRSVVSKSNTLFQRPSDVYISTYSACGKRAQRCFNVHLTSALQTIVRTQRCLYSPLNVMLTELQSNAL